MTGPTPPSWQPPSMSPPPVPPPPQPSSGRSGSNATLGIVAAVVAVVLVGVGVWWFTKSDDSSSTVDVNFPSVTTAVDASFPSPVEPTSPSIDVPTGGGFPAAVREAYLTSCGSSSGGNVQYCECTLRELEARISFEDFLALEENYAATGELPPVMSQIAEICL